MNKLVAFFIACLFSLNLFSQISISNTTGDIITKKTNNGEYILFFDAKVNGITDGMVDSMYVLQTEEFNSTYFTQGEFHDLKLTITSTFIVMENNDESLILSLFNNDLSDILHSIHGGLLINGYGLSQISLSHLNVSMAAVSNQLEIESAWEYIDILLVAAGGTTTSSNCSNCSTGGPGATSCSKSGSFGTPITGETSCSCSVSCSSGSYACCSTCQKCKCCPNGGGAKRSFIEAIYPNPADAYMVVRFDPEVTIEALSQIIIQNINTGNVVYYNNELHEEYSIDTSSMQEGIYIVTVFADGFVESKTVVIAH